MRINKFFMGLGAVAALSLAACSNDEPANKPEGPVTSGDQTYLTVQISEQNGRSRAEGDINQEGTDGMYQDGFKLGEAEVRSCDFYFYDENGVYVMTSNTLFAAGTPDQHMPNIELQGASVVVLDKLKEKGYPKYMVTVLNKPAGFEPANTLTELNTQLVGLGKENSTDAPVRFIANNAEGNATEYFTMTTTSFAGQTMRGDANTALPYYFVNELIESDFKSTVEEAKKAENTVKVYVERLAAKVAVNINMTPVEDLENTFELRMSVAGGNNNDQYENADYVANYKLYIKFSAWGLNATAKDSYYMKNINTAWTNDDLGFTWNNRDYFRSYWGQSYTYSDENSDTYNYFSYNDLTNAYWEADEKGKQHAAYTTENTHPAVFLNTENNYDKVTSVLLAAEVYDPEEGEGKDFVMYSGVLFKADRFRDYVLTNCTPNIWKKSGAEGGFVQADSEYKITKQTGVNKVSVKFEAEEGVTYYKQAIHVIDGAETKTYEPLADADIVAANNALANYEGEGFAGGKMYYNIPIAHLRSFTKDNKETFAAKNLLEGHYGVVRNHYYYVNVNSLSKLGTGVWDPDEDIIPTTPPDDEEYCIGAEIKILSWRIVNNDVDL